MLRQLINRLGLGRSEGSNVKPSETRSGDSWAETIRVELKSLISQEILTELAHREDKFLSSILARSHFYVESLVVTPLDYDTSSRFESFLGDHLQIDPNFKTDFFRSLLESQYRSTRGAIVTVAPNFQPTVQFLTDSLEQPSQDELYQISLRGRRFRFRVAVALMGPIPRANSESAPSAFSQHSGLLVKQETDSQVGTEMFVIKIRDAEGERDVEVSSPCLLGRESPTLKELGGVNFVSVKGRYVSRRHLMLVAVMDETYFFLHGAASLSCITADGTVLEHSAVYCQSEGSALTLVLGDSETSKRTNDGTRPVDQFPIVTISRKGVVAMSTSHATPRPRAIR